MKRALLLCLIALAAACRRPKVPTVAVKPEEASAPAGVAMIDFAEKSGAYSCRAPAEWKLLEDPVDGEDVTFFGPRGVSISIGRYDGSSGPVKTPRDYYDAAKAAADAIGDLETAVVGGREIFRLHGLKPVRAPNARKVLYVEREDVALIPAGKGFLAVEHRAPRASYRATLPVFEAILASLKPAAAPTASVSAR